MVNEVSRHRRLTSFFLTLIPYYGYRIGLKEGHYHGFNEGIEFAEELEERLVSEFNFFVSALQREHDYQMSLICRKEMVH